ncbi:MAG: hypothetical protein HYU84_09830 [Chloroflexi bacterium]|nr:hypothetical protein [Chloroflexota bacterium]
MDFIKKHFVNLIILLILAVGVYFRSAWYGDLRLSVANAETDSYMSSAQSSIFSWEIFSGQRLFTTNLIYKFANDPVNCPITSYGKPGIGEEAERKIQGCFDKVVLIQNYLSIFGWCFLGWMVANKLNNPLIKIFAATAIMLFGFTPQIAEWDSVLSPESLSLSMFAITLGLALELVFRAGASEKPLSRVFVRDVHLYAIPITLALLAPLFLVKKFRDANVLRIAVVVLLFFFAIGYLSARESLRATRYPLMNSLDEYIWPHPSRVEFFRKFGMPDKDAPSYFDAPIYQAWADKNATKAYAAFLATHPGFVVTTLWANIDLLIANYAQPYFLTYDVKNRDSLSAIGEMVNPESGAAYLLTFVVTLAFLLQMVTHKTTTLSIWAWLAIWAYGIAIATLLISYFGDTAGLRRHIMPSVELVRLHLLVFLLPFLDLSLKTKTSTGA